MMAANKYHNSFVQSCNLSANYTVIIRESQILIYYELAYTTYLLVRVPYFQILGFSLTIFLK